jgi:hypothetical protein
MTGMDRIPPDSSRNLWGTVKTSVAVVVVMGREVVVTKVRRGSVSTTVA